MGTSRARANFSSVSTDGNGVIVFDARYVTPQQAGSLLDVALGQHLGFAQLLQPISDDQCFPPQFGIVRVNQHEKLQCNSRS
jgi:hypothetical protein